MLKVKLAPTGKKHQRSYQIVIAEGKSKITGNKLDVLGHFHPLVSKTDPARFVIDLEKLKSWIARGAQVTPKIRKLAHLDK